MNQSEREQLHRGIAQARDRRNRKHLLTALFELRANPSGWSSAVTLRDAASAMDPIANREGDDVYWLGLLRDLQIKGLVEERPRPRRRSEAFSLRHLEYRLLAAGLNLHLENAPPDPIVDDDRVVE